VREALIATLYAQPSSLIMGAANAIVVSIIAAYVAQRIELNICSWLLTIVVTGRVTLAFVMPRMADGGTRLPEIAYNIGAFSQASLTGIIAALALYLDVPPAAQILLLCNAVGYAASIAARNAGRPAIAIGQMFLTMIPVCVALLMQDSMALRALCFSIAMLLAATTSITLNVFRVMRSSVAAAHNSARTAAKMQILARTDVVTGLLNRSGLNHFLGEYVRARQSDGKIALFWLDLDRFKEINDTLGHQVGDRLLAEVARRLAAQAPDEAIVARFGGDEFIVACAVKSHHKTRMLADAILADLTRPMSIDSGLLEVGSSMGIAIMPDDAQDIDTLLQCSDMALYRSKVNGRGQVNFFHPSMTRSLVRRREIEAELRAALQRDELSIFYQPIIDLRTGKIRAFEALIRWFHPEKGEIPPDEFIPVAEETGAIITLGNWVTMQAAKTAARWPNEITIAVNLSPIQIKAPGASLAILTALRCAGLDPHRMELEITETALLEQSENTESFMADLSAAGVRFALDDFGTGYSSLGNLNKYAFSKIKVDRSFVSGEHVSKRTDAIIRAVSGMGATLGMEIVAEGLETIEQVQAVRDAGCTLGQGYYFSRAVPGHIATTLLLQERDGVDPELRVA
jgi:diguanylate cyclase (GGDEF)-like protein